MRTYGTSPLNQYVELIFRARKMFIVSILVCLIASIAFAVVRSKSYTAEAIIFLSGTEETGPTQLDREDRVAQGSIRYKITLLNVLLKDKKTLRTRFDLAHLTDPYPTEEGKNDFTKRAKDALSFQAAENVLTISCKWKEKDISEQIIRAFFAEYSERVVDDATAMSKNEQQYLSDALVTAEKKENDLNIAVREYRKKHVEDSISTPEATAQNFETKKTELRRLQTDAASTGLNLNLVASFLAKTPREVEESKTFQSFKSTREFEQLSANRDQLKASLDELSLKYQENHPDIRRLKLRLAQIDAALKAANTDEQPKKKQVPFKRTMVINPKYTSLDIQQQELGLRQSTLSSQIALAQQDLTRLHDKAVKAPDQNYDFAELTKYQDLNRAIRQNLATQTQKAEIDAKRDVTMQRTKMSMVVEPRAEPDGAGAKSLLFVIAGPLIGLIIAFSISLMAETMDHSLRTPSEVEKYLGKPVLATLPLEKGKSGTSRLLSGGNQARTTLPNA